jgi:hypothetical protein
MQHLQKTRGYLNSSPRLSSSVAAFLSHLPYILPRSVSRKPFICHSYENTRGVGVFFPFWFTCLPRVSRGAKSKGTLSHRYRSALRIPDHAAKENHAFL